MTLLTRASRLLRADLNAVFDLVEDPASTLRQAVCDMGATIAADNDKLASMAADVDELNREYERLAHGCSAINEDLDTCFESGEENLARTLIRRRLLNEAAMTQIASRRENIGRAREALAERLNRQRELYDQMRLKAAALSERSDEREPMQQTAEISREDVEVAFLKERKRREQS